MDVEQYCGPPDRHLDEDDGGPPEHGSIVDACLRLFLCCLLVSFSAVFLVGAYAVCRLLIGGA